MEKSALSASFSGFKGAHLTPGAAWAQLKPVGTDKLGLLVASPCST